MHGANLNCQPGSRWGLTSVLPEKLQISFISDESLSCSLFVFHLQLLILTDCETQTRPADPTGIIWLTAWDRSPSRTSCVSNVQLTHTNPVHKTHTHLSSNTHLRCSVTVHHPSQVLQSHTHTQEYLQPCLRVITLHIELIMFHRTINNRVCPEESGDTHLPFRTITNCSCRRELCVTHSEVYATDFCSVYQADDQCKYSGLQRKRKPPSPAAAVTFASQWTKETISINSTRAVMQSCKSPPKAWKLKSVNKTLSHLRVNDMS